MKLTTRYNRFVIPSITIVFLISIISSYFLIRKVLQNELDEIILRTKSRIETYIQQNNRIPGISTFNDQIIHFEKLNGPLTDSGFHSTTQYIPEQNKNHISRLLIFHTKINNEQWKVTISQPLEGTRHLTILIAKIAIVTISFTLLLVIIINRRVLNRVWEPFYQSLAQIKTFKVNNNVSPSFPESDIEEFKLMNIHFKLAADNASRDYRNLKEFSENASHEIQTPLAIMRSNLDLLTQENMTEKQSELLESVYSAVSKLSRLQQSLLLLTKIDNRQFTQSEDIRLDEAVKEKINQFQELWHNKNIHSSADLGCSVINTNKELLDILLNNLYSNATRHNLPRGSIHTELKENCLIISNTGIDQPLDPERIFRRFYKNSLQTESNGLGLSIIKQICDTSSFNISYKFENGWHRFIILV
jgi:signal transduction histidine kinase